MWCPRCKSARIQRGYNNTLILLRLAGLHELLCNNCGLEFKGLDPLGKLVREPSKRRELSGNQRRAPRYKAHLPATISLVERNVLTWDVAYTQPSRGHCEVISQIGMALSFVGSRLSKEQLTRPGCPLFVTVDLPAGAVAAVVYVVYWEHAGTNRGAEMVVGTPISPMSDKDAALVPSYLETRAQRERGHT